MSTMSTNTSLLRSLLKELEQADRDSYWAHSKSFHKLQKANWTKCFFSAINQAVLVFILRINIHSIPKQLQPWTRKFG